MSRGLWWIITAIMLVVFMPIGILLLGIVILREIFFMLNGDVEEEVDATSGIGSSDNKSGTADISSAIGTKDKAKFEAKDKVEEKIEAKLEEKIEAKLEEKIEAKLEDKIDDKLQDI